MNEQFAENFDPTARAQSDTFKGEVQAIELGLRERKFDVLDRTKHAGEDRFNRHLVTAIGSRDLVIVVCDHAGDTIIAQVCGLLWRWRTAVIFMAKKGKVIEPPILKELIQQVIMDRDGEKLYVEYENLVPDALAAVNYFVKTHQTLHRKLSAEARRILDGH